jgi:RNA polymerase sigma-70 factor (ECF subfamily)
MSPREREAALESARRGDADALGRLLESYRPYVRVLVRAFRGDRLQARLDDSDLIQEGLLEAHRSFARFQGGTAAELTAWVRQVVLRTAGHSVRSHLGSGRRDANRERSTVDPADLVDVDACSPAAEAVRHEQAAQMAAALARLPEDMQQVLLGRHVDDLPYAALAERLGRSEAAVRVLYTRALRRLRDECRVRESPT